jgi:hypothetical protein
MESNLTETKSSCVGYGRRYPPIRSRNSPTFHAAWMLYHIYNIATEMYPQLAESSSHTLLYFFKIIPYMPRFFKWFLTSGLLQNL